MRNPLGFILRRLSLFPFCLLQANGLAALGKYKSSGSAGAAAQSLYVANHAY